jgi:transposase
LCCIRIGIHYTTICGWWKTYEREGAKGIRLKTRGRKQDAKRTLNPEQEKELQKIIQDKEPDQLKLPFALWTRRAVLRIIKKFYGIDMPVRTVGEYLKRWGFTPQKPLKRPPRRAETKPINNKIHLIPTCYIFT